MAILTAGVHDNGDVLRPRVGGSTGLAVPLLRLAGRRVFLCALLGMVVGWASGIPIGMAAEPTFSEYQVKAAFLIKFPKYVTWPEEAFATTNSPFVVAVPGESRMLEEIQKALAGRTVDGRAIVLKRVAEGEHTGHCHIRFISAAEQQRSPKLPAALTSAGILTVGESSDFLEYGGIINLARRDEKIALHVNLAAAGKARIKISSQLLGVASVVKKTAR